MATSLKQLHYLLDNVDPAEYDILSKILLKFIPEVEHLSDEIEATKKMEAAIAAIKEVKPDEWDLVMLKEIEEKPEEYQSYITQEQLIAELEQMNEKMVEIEVTLPLWLDEMATAAGLDYSDILQKALIDYLGISTPTK